MVIVLKADVGSDSAELAQIVALAESFPGVSTRVHVVQGATRSLTEIYLLGPTHAVPTKPFEEFEAVEKVVRITEKFRAIGRHDGQPAALAGQLVDGALLGSREHSCSFLSNLKHFRA